MKVKRHIFHQELYPASLAVYASPENIAEFEEERKVCLSICQKNWAQFDNYHVKEIMSKL